MALLLELPSLADIRLRLSYRQADHWRVLRRVQVEAFTRRVSVSIAATGATDDTKLETSLASREVKHTQAAVVVNAATGSEAIKAR